MTFLDHIGGAYACLRGYFIILSGFTDNMELSEVELCIELRIELRLPKVELTNVFGTIVELFLMKLNYCL